MEQKESNTNEGFDVGAARFSYFRGPITNVEPTGGPVGLQWLVDVTRAGLSPQHRESIERLRLMYAEGDEDGSNTLKEHLAYITGGGIFKKRSNWGLLAHSRLIILDWDKLSSQGQTPEEVREVASRHLAVVAAFISPRGDGVKVVVALKDAPTNSRENHRAYAAACRALGINIPADKMPKAISSACYISWDPNCYLAAPKTVALLDWRAMSDSPAKKSGRGNGEKGKRKFPKGAPSGTAGLHPTPAEWGDRCPQLYETGTQLEGPCPACGGTDRFHVNFDPPHYWLCRDCQEGDHMAPLYAAFPERSPDLGGDPEARGDRWSWWVKGEFLTPWSRTHDADCARGVRQHAHQFLVVETDLPASEVPRPRDSAWLLVDNGYGIWRNRPPLIHQLLGDTAIEWALAARREGLANHKQIYDWSRGMASTEGRRKAASCVGRVLEGWRQSGTVPPGLIACTPDRLDADGRYLGTLNGVVDLATGELLSRDVARTKLVTRMPVTYGPEARHPAVDRLANNLEEDVREFLWRSLGRGLWRQPDKFFLVLVGPTDSGKDHRFRCVALRAGAGGGGHVVRGRLASVLGSAA